MQETGFLSTELLALACVHNCFYSRKFVVSLVTKFGRILGIYMFSVNSTHFAILFWNGTPNFQYQKIEKKK
jgi:hypothetical protein